jgi:hypothetical protein
VLKGHADEYSKPVPGSITGCSPITPLPLHKGIMISLLKNKNKNKLSSSSDTTNLKKNKLSTTTLRDQKQFTIRYQPNILNFSIGISNNPMSSEKLNRAV